MVDVFANGDMLEDIHHVNDQIVIASNGSSNMTSEMGVLPGYGPVWYDPIGIANIVSLSRVREKYHVSFNSKQPEHIHGHQARWNCLRVQTV
jgi:hypothetical protein